MPVGERMGARIRARRADLGLKQTDLAAAVGISAPYLNLIEHDRRRIGGKLLLSLARALKVDASVLAEGAEAGLVAALDSAAGGRAAEMGRAADFAARFPGWAGLVVAQQRRVERLEQTVETLSDRLTHDPALAAALHEVLSVVTAIRSTAAILNDERDLGRDWLDRFHGNIDADARRLAGSARALVAYLDGEGGAAPVDGVETPQEGFERWLAAGTPEPLPPHPEAQALAEGWRAQTERDRARLPDADLAAALAEEPDPVRLAGRLGVPVSTVFRRLAGAGRGFGLLVADAAGALLVRLPPEGFQMPRLGAACPLWPLFAALSRPLQPWSGVIEQSARTPRRFRAWAVAEPTGPAGPDATPAFRGLMLLAPDDGGAGPAQPVGTTCRVCPRPRCPARREASVLPG